MMSEATGSTICPKCGRYYIHVEQTVTAPQPTCECYKSDNQIIQPSIGHDQVTISGEEYRRLINLQSAHDKLKQRIEGATKAKLKHDPYLNVYLDYHGVDIKTDVEYYFLELTPEEMDKS